MFNSPIGRWNNSSQLWWCVNQSHLERKKIILKQAQSKLFWFRMKTPGHLPYREQDFEAGFSTASPSLFFPVHWTLQCKKLFDSFPLHKIMRKDRVVKFFNHSDAQWVSLPDSWALDRSRRRQLRPALALTCTDPSPPWITGLLHSGSFTPNSTEIISITPQKFSPGQMCKQIWFVGPILVCHQWRSPKCTVLPSQAECRSKHWPGRKNQSSKLHPRHSSSLSRSKMLVKESKTPVGMRQQEQSAWKGNSSSLLSLEGAGSHNSVQPGPASPRAHSRDLQVPISTLSPKGISSQAPVLIIRVNIYSYSMAGRSEYYTQVK